MLDTLSELKAQILFQGLSDEDIGKIAPLVSPVTFQKDEHVFRIDEPSKGIYLVKSGAIEISKTTADGWKQPLVILKRGSFVGEIATLEKTNHASDARAMEPAELYLLRRETLDEMEKKEPSIMLKIIKNIAIIGGLNIRRMNDKFIKVLVNY